MSPPFRPVPRFGGIVLIAAIAAIVQASDGPNGDARAGSGVLHPLRWDAIEQTIVSPPGAQKVDFIFTVTNHSAQPVSLRAVHPSCGCTTFQLPLMPWTLAPRARFFLHGSVDLRHKTGLLSKTIGVESTVGLQTLTINVQISPPDEATRQRNQQAALADRQAVFRGECASCHVDPIAGKTGVDLFNAACGICHDTPHRASMVPNLKQTRVPRDEAYWLKWIADGKEGTLMPAFAAKHGGPLSEEQILALVAFGLEQFPVEPPAKD
ncbi:MAG TPA: c-type cytochrome [Opitutaceae bacterium]|nr:c-type cytochrome [Opitutaceae bacterium]